MKYLRMKDFTLITNWAEKNLVCETCGSNKSVKYVDAFGYPTCNACFLKIIGAVKTVPEAGFHDIKVTNINGTRYMNQMDFRHYLLNSAAANRKAASNEFRGSTAFDVFNAVAEAFENVEKMLAETPVNY